MAPNADLLPDMETLKHPQPLIINAALTGVMPNKAQNPNVPTSVDEIIADGVRCFDAGATILHLHARNDDGVATSDPARYEAILSGIRAQRPEAVLCATTTRRGVSNPGDRLAVLSLTGDAKPDMASLTMGSVDFRDVSVTATEAEVRDKAALMLEKGIKPELEIFHSGMLNSLKLLMAKDLFRTPVYCNFILGLPHMAQATSAELNHLIATLPSDTLWAAGGAGYAQYRVNLLSIALGGHVRVGLEDNLWMDMGREKLATNQTLVARVARLAGEIGRPVATPQQTRELLGLGS